MLDNINQHQKAMDLAEKAFFLKRRGQVSAAIDLFSEAFVLESQIALTLEAISENEPSRSVFFRSAASLALRAEKFGDAEKMVAEALRGFPQISIRNELLDILDEITFHRHLELKGIILDDTNVSMNLSGPIIANGIAPTDELFGKVESFKSILRRTNERMQKVPFDGKGNNNKKVKRFKTYIEALVPGSFTVLLRFGEVDRQIEWTGDEPDPKKVIEEVASCIELITTTDDIEQLRRKIPDHDYLQNFIGLAKQIAPDGKYIKTIGFNFKTDGKIKPIALRKIKEEINQQFPIDKDLIHEISKNNEMEYRGKLQAADSIRVVNGYKTIKLEVENNKKGITILVPQALMKDVVQPYYEENVIIKARIDEKNQVILEEISLESEID